MDLPARWTNPTGWAFHVDDANIIRDYVSNVNYRPATADPETADEENLQRLEGLKFRREWMENSGEGNPPNYDWIKSVTEEFTDLVLQGKFVPGFIEKRVFQNVIFYTLTKFKQDIAYREVMGGYMTVIVLDPVKWVSCQTKEDRIGYLLRMRKWLDQSYQRPGRKEMVMTIYDEFVKRYTKSLFVEQAVNWFIDQLIKHQPEWVVDPAYNPKTWYPVGRGQIQNLVCAGEG